jgi:hypothetical protein
VVVKTAGEESPQLTAIPTVWKFHGGAFVEQHDPNISAQVVPQLLFADFVGPGPEPLPAHVADSVVIKLPDALRGATATPYRIQALSVGSGRLAEVIDRLDDSPGEPGRAVDWSPPKPPVRTVTPTVIPPGGSGMVHISGFLTKFDRHILKKTGGVMNVFFDNEVIATRQPHCGPVVRCVPFRVPEAATTGLHVLSVVAAGTALEAQCGVEVSFAAQVSRDVSGEHEDDSCEGDSRGDKKEEEKSEGG